jgi:hypothetical protein
VGLRSHGSAGGSFALARRAGGVYSGASGTTARATGTVTVVQNGYINVIPTLGATRGISSWREPNPRLRSLAEYVQGGPRDRERTDPICRRASGLRRLPGTQTTPARYLVGDHLLTRREAARGFMGALAAGPLTGLLAQSAYSTESHYQIPRAKRTWIIQSPALRLIAERSSTALRALRNDVVLVPFNRDYPIPAAASKLNIILVGYYASEHNLKRAQYIYKGTKAILYDNEDQPSWHTTPEIEKDHQYRYYKRAAKLSHSHGYAFIATPLSKDHPRLVARVAPFADVLDIQAQWLQSSTTRYSSHVLPLAREVRHANPSTIILSGLSTNSNLGGIPTPSQLVACAKSVQPFVHGYWLNMPTATRRDGYADIACKFLELLGPTG